MHPSHMGFDPEEYQLRHPDWDVSLPSFFSVASSRQAPHFSFLGFLQFQDRRRSPKWNRPKIRPHYVAVELCKISQNIGHLNFDYLGQSFSDTGLNWLVVLIILKNMSSSIGRIIPYIVDK